MAKKETLDTIEATIDTIDETLDTLERIPKVNLNGTTKNQQIVILSTVAGVSLVAGVAAGYAWAKKRVQKNPVVFNQYNSNLPADKYVKGSPLG